MKTFTFHDICETKQFSVLEYKVNNLPPERDQMILTT